MDKGLGDLEPGIPQVEISRRHLLRLGAALTERFWGHA